MSAVCQAGMPGAEDSGISIHSLLELKNEGENGY